MGEPLLLTSNNTTLVAYLKKQGGTVSLDMCRLAQEIFTWLELHIVTIATKYILGKNNILADQLSFPDQVFSIRWSFLPQEFDNICS